MTHWNMFLFLRLQPLKMMRYEARVALAFDLRHISQRNSGRHNC